MTAFVEFAQTTKQGSFPIAHNYLNFLTLHRWSDLQSFSSVTAEQNS